MFFLGLSKITFAPLYGNEIVRNTQNILQEQNWSDDRGTKKMLWEFIGRRV